MTVPGGTPGTGSKSPVKIFANIFISFIGAGILGLPFAFKESGILEGVVIMSFVGFVSVKAMILIVDCKYKLTNKVHVREGSPSSTDQVILLKEQTETLLEVDKNNIKDEPKLPEAPGNDSLSYGDVGYYAMGHTGQLLVEFSIVVSQIGFCCAYLIFISENLSQHIEGLSLIYWLLILLPLVYCLVLIRELSTLSISSLFAQASNLLAFAVVFWFDFEHFSKINMHPKEFSLEGFPFFFSVAIYCYEGAGMILCLESSLAKSVRHRFKFYFQFTLLIVTTLYISFGACGYLSFGRFTNEIITLNLPRGQSMNFALVVKSCLCLALFFTYPVMMFPVVNILEPKLISSPATSIWKGNILRLVLVCSTGIVVLAIPNFATMMALVGASICTMLAFILPGIFHMKIFRGSLTKRQLCWDVFLIILGVVGGVVGTWDTLVRLKDVHAARGAGVPTTTMASLVHNVTSGPAPPAQLVNATLHHVTTMGNISKS